MKTMDDSVKFSLKASDKCSFYKQEEFVFDLDTESVQFDSH